MADDAYPRIADPVRVFYTRFRDRELIPDGVKLSFEQWMQFATEYADHFHKLRTRDKEA